MEEEKWSEWHPLIGPEFVIPPTSGIYEVRWAIDGKPQTIPRFCCDDTTGLLYIGRAEKLNQRISHLVRSINGKTNFPHTAVYSFNEFSFEKLVKPEYLEVRWTLTDDILFVEDKLIRAYIEEFLDKPPLNFVFPKRMLGIK